MRSNPHTLQELKETIEQNLPVYQDQNFIEARNIFIKFRACLRARDQHLETLRMKSCRLIYRINTDYELQAEAGFVYNEVLERAGVLRPEMKYSLPTLLLLFSFYRKILDYSFFPVNFIFNYIPSCLLKILITVTAIFLSLLLSFFISLCKNSYFGVKC